MKDLSKRQIEEKIFWLSTEYRSFQIEKLRQLYSCYRKQGLTRLDSYTKALEGLGK